MHLYLSHGYANLRLDWDDIFRNVERHETSKQHGLSETWTLGSVSISVWIEGRDGGEGSTAAGTQHLRCCSVLPRPPNLFSTSPDGDHEARAPRTHTSDFQLVVHGGSYCLFPLGQERLHQSCHFLSILHDHSPVSIVIILAQQVSVPIPNNKFRIIFGAQHFLAIAEIFLLLFFKHDNHLRSDQTILLLAY
jgi:hypothetical protein